MIKPVPKDYHPSDKPFCSGYSGLVFDTIFASTNVAGTTLMVMAVADRGRINAWDALVGAGYLALSVVFIVSGIYGFQSIKQCQLANSSHRAWKDEMGQAIPQNSR
jgi:hypothetical protein